MVTVEHKKTGQIPHKGFTLPRQLWHQIGKTVSAQNKKRAAAGARVDGTAQKPNAPSTRKRKLRVRGHATPGVDTGERFGDGARHEITIGRDHVRISLARSSSKGASAVEVVGYLSKKGYTYIFGLASSPDVEIIDRLFHTHISKMVARRGAARGGVFQHR